MDPKRAPWGRSHSPRDASALPPLSGTFTYSSPDSTIGNHQSPQCPVSPSADTQGLPTTATKDFQHNQLKTPTTDAQIGCPRQETPVANTRAEAMAMERIGQLDQN